MRRRNIRRLKRALRGRHRAMGFFDDVPDRFAATPGDRATRSGDRRDHDRPIDPLSEPIRYELGDDERYRLARRPDQLAKDPILGRIQR